MSTHDIGRRQANKKTFIRRNPVSRSAPTRSVWVLIALSLIVLAYITLSADCATPGGSCTFANGDWFNWIATHRQVIGGIIGALIGTIIIGKIARMTRGQFIVFALFATATVIILILY